MILNSHLIKHSSFCWENMTAMRYMYKTTSFINMQNTFQRRLTEEYQEALVTLSKLIRDATVLAPEMKSLVLLTPFNTGWEWVEGKQNIRSIEVWADGNQISEITQERLKRDRIQIIECIKIVKASHFSFFFSFFSFGKLHGT